MLGAAHTVMGKTSLCHRDKRHKEDCRNPYKKAITLRLLIAICSHWFTIWNEIVLCLEVILPWGTVSITYTPQNKSEGQDTTYQSSSGFPDSSVSKEPACNAGDPSLIPGSRRSAGEEIGYPLQYSWVSPVAQLVKNPPEMQETWGWSLGWEDSLWEGKGYPLQYSCLENSMDWQATDHGVTELDMTE